MRRVVGAFFIFLFFLGCVSPASQTSTLPASNETLSPPALPRVCIREKCFNVEVADSLVERQTGLMNRSSLGADAGMLFVFDEMGNHPFWMKNTLIPLDAVWLDASGKIVDVQTMVPCAEDPCPKYVPVGDSQFVLEINAGQAKLWGISPGFWAYFSGEGLESFSE